MLNPTQTNVMHRENVGVGTELTEDVFWPKHFSCCWSLGLGSMLSCTLRFSTGRPKPPQEGQK